MNKIRKTIVLEGNNCSDLEHRVDAFRKTVEGRTGTILRLAWMVEEDGAAKRVSILYQLPLGNEQAPTAHL